MLVLRVIWLVFVLLCWAFTIYEARIESRHPVLVAARPWYAIPLRAILSLTGPFYVAIQFGAYCGGIAKSVTLRAMLAEQEHCPLCGACHAQQGKVQEASE